jgi:hypothetical protein
MLVNEALVQVPVSCGRTTSADKRTQGRKKEALAIMVGKNLRFRVGKGYLLEIYNVIYFLIR